MKQDCIATLSKREPVPVVPVPVVPWFMMHMVESYEQVRYILADLFEP